MRFIFCNDYFYIMKDVECTFKKKKKPKKQPVLFLVTAV